MVKILLVDDQQSILQAYKEFLEENNFLVITADTPRKALSLLDKETLPIIIITDIKFPAADMDGFELIRKVKKEYPLHEIIIISGHATMEFVIEAIRLDASDFIPKPCEMNLLLLAINRADNKIQMRQIIKEYTESLEHNVQERTDEIKRMEAQLIQAAKLSAMGELSASVCHELRQPLCGIMGFSDLIGKKLSEDNSTKSYLEKLNKQCERMEELIENLRTFSRQADTSFEPMSIGESIEDALSLFDQQLKNHHIKITKEIPQGLPLILGNKTKLQQVFVNLICNARDAVNSLTNQKEKHILIHCQKKDQDTVLISITDNGVGIKRNLQARVFDSFFSTKSVKKGTGLGLSIARTIIDDLKGQIDFVSTPGEGTSFTVELPILELLGQKIQRADFSSEKVVAEKPLLPRRETPGLSL